MLYDLEFNIVWKKAHNFFKIGLKRTDYKYDFSFFTYKI